MAMSRSRALARARIELGKGGGIRFNPKPGCYQKRCEIEKVVSVGGVSFAEIRAGGDTWEEAFEQLDRRQRAVEVSLLPEELEEILGEGPGEKLRGRLEQELERAKR